MLEKNILNWLKEYFRKISDLPDNFEEVNYLESGLIDSLGIILLIEEIEKEFNVTFTEDYFQERRFVSIKGLSEIIKELQNDRK